MSSVSGDVAVVAVGGDSGGVDQAANTGVDRGREHVPRAVHIDVVAVGRRLDDDEREVNDDVGSRHERVDRAPVEDVAPAVGDLVPPVCLGIEWPPCHRQHP
jgi:hypothetical protein